MTMPCSPRWLRGNKVLMRWCPCRGIRLEALMGCPRRGFRMASGNIGSRRRLSCHTVSTVITSCRHGCREEIYRLIISSVLPCAIYAGVTVNTMRHRRGGNGWHRHRGLKAHAINVDRIRHHGSVIAHIHANRRLPRRHPQPLSTCPRHRPTPPSSMSWRVSSLGSIGISSKVGLTPSLHPQATLGTCLIK